MTLKDDMHPFAILCFAGASVLAVGAVRYQRRYFVPGHGGSMGTEIVNLLIWGLVSLLAAAGSMAFIPWYLCVLVLMANLALSFVIRYCINR